jgi:hypothetical protein
LARSQLPVRFTFECAAKQIEMPMFGRTRTICALLLLMMLAMPYAGSGQAAENIWRVAKSSGEVSMTTAAGQQTALTDGATVKPGDNIRTGQTGRVLLTRGEETILISPNSAVGIPAEPAEKKSELSTTIIQQAGSILLEVEKRDVKHFVVETPYLAAVVKGTQFRVTVNKNDSRVDVVRGQVEVSDFKSGKYALVQPGQTAQVSALGSAGLSLSGVGSLSPIQQGTPRVASMNIPVPTIAPSARSAPTAAAPAEFQAPYARSSTSSPNDISWSSLLPSSSTDVLGAGGRNSRDDDIVAAAAISCAVGLVVAFVVGVQRRRKSRKLAKG